MAQPPVRPARTTRARLIAAVAAGLLVSSGIVATTATANATSPDLVINEVYSGGGNSGAAYTHDFVEIPEIRGAAHRSPLAGTKITTSGVVTAVKYDGFWTQDPRGDSDDATSDGIFVYTGSQGAKPSVGDAIELAATVQQYRPGSASGANLSITELVDATFTPLAGTLPMPDPVVLGPDGRAVPSTIAGADEGGERTDIEASGTYDPAADAISFYKSLEGMLVSVRDAAVVGPTNSFGELTVVPAGTDGLVRTPEGGVAYPGYDQPNTGRLTVDDEIIYEQLPAANIGDTLSGEVSGPLHYDFGTYRMYPDEIPTVAAGGVEPDVVEPPRPGELAVAAFNVENLSPVDPPEKFAALAEQIVTNLAAPDILALEEVQDNTGPECPDGDGCEPDGVVDADQTLDQLVSAIKAAGGPAYEWRQISPENLADGGEPTGNIRNAFLYRTDRGVRFVDRPGGDATTATEVTKAAGKAALTLSPGRVAPTDPAFENSRKPLAAQFTFRGEPLILIANHFSSKGGDEPIFGRWQPPNRSSEADRWAQAKVVHDFVAGILGVQANAKVIVLGDINDFEFSQTTKILTGEASRPTLYSLPKELLPPEQRYSYVYQGNSQVLDQILVSPDLFGVRAAARSPIRAYDLVHVNAGFADQVSDHDPQVVHLLPRRSPA